MIAVLPGTNETHRLAHFKAERALFFSSFMGGPYISSGSLEELPTFPLCVPHGGCYYHANVNRLQLARPPRAAATAQHRSAALSHCHWLPATKRRQVARNGGRKVARAKEKENYNFCVVRESEEAGREALEPGVGRHGAARATGSRCSQGQRSPYARTFATSLSLCATAIQN